MKKTKEQIIEELEIIASKNVNYKSGKVFGYTYSAGKDCDDLIEHIYSKYMHENALDPIAFPSCKNLERMVIKESSKFVNLPDSGDGCFTSGGTESILMALRSCREFHKNRGKKVLIPITAHPASLKACDYLGLEPIMLPVNKDYKLTREIVEEYYQDGVIAVIASAPSYGVGVIDEIKSIGLYLESKNIEFIVDACMGGMVLPFFDNGILWDFRVKGVSMLCLDFHKFGYSCKGSSAVFYRNSSMKSYQTFTCSDWMGYSIVNMTMMNTKSGGPVAATWAVMNYLGETGYRKIVSNVLNGVKTLIQEIENIPELYIIGKPELNLFSFSSKEINILCVSELLQKMGWYLQIQYKYQHNEVIMPENIHITFGNSNIIAIKEFIRDLKNCILEIKRENLKDSKYDEINNTKINNRNEKLQEKVLGWYSIK